jgi:hypothetical protein
VSSSYLSVNSLGKVKPSLGLSGILLELLGAVLEGTGGGREGNAEEEDDDEVVPGNAQFGSESKPDEGGSSF